MSEGLDASRLAGFSDGVFAVAITLLVLNVQVPSEPIRLSALLAAQFPNDVVFVLTFAIVGIKWLNHHRMFARIRRVDTTLNILNLLLLMGICVVPFTAALVAKYVATPDAAHASTVYGAVWALNGLLYVAIFAYARRAGFVEAVASDRRTAVLYALGPFGYLAGAALSYANVYAGLAVYLVFVLLYVPPQR